MAVHQYIATADGYYGGDVIKAGATFAAEFKTLKRAEPKNKDDVGQIERDKNGNAVFVAGDDPMWVQRASAAEAAAIDASDSTVRDVNYAAMSPTELRAVAATMGIDVTNLKSKDDLLTAINAVHAEPI